jgi:simple sugar transport system permease protein
MATTSPTFSTPARRGSWREYVKLTRMTIFSILFILIGAWLIIGGSNSIDGSTVTRLTFGANVSDLLVPTLSYSIVVGVLYVLGGIVGLVGNESSTAMRRLRWGWLFLNGLLIIPTVLIVAAAGNSTNVTVMLQVSLRLATPIVMGALAGIWCERSGVVNIAIEGMMLSGACFGFVALTLLAPSMGTPQAQLVGILVATASGGLMALLHGWLSITFKTDQVVSGTVINILAVGLTSFVRREILFSSEAGRETLGQLPIPVLSDIPVVGDVLFQGRPIFYMMFVLLVVTHVVLFYTRWGLRTRAVGENPRAADTVGINVIRNRWINVFIGGLIAGLAGAWFSLETTGGFDDNMTSGRGFIALAAMIFGKYTPLGALGGGLLFGFSDALGQRFQFLGVQVPAQFLQMVPYVITIVVLAGLVGKAVGPKADGIPYEKEGK